MPTSQGKWNGDFINKAIDQEKYLQPGIQMYKRFIYSVTTNMNITQDTAK